MTARNIIKLSMAVTCILPLVAIGLAILALFLLTGCAADPTATPAPMAADVKPLRVVVYVEPQPTPEPTCTISTGIEKGNVNLRSTPNGEIIGSLPEGAQVRLLETGKYWHRVQAGDAVGYVYSLLCEVTK